MSDYKVIEPGLRFRMVIKSTVENIDGHRVRVYKARGKGAVSVGTSEREVYKNLVDHVRGGTSR